MVNRMTIPGLVECMASDYVESHSRKRVHLGPSARWRFIVKYKQNNEKPLVRKQAIEILVQDTLWTAFSNAVVLTVNSLVTFSADKKSA